MTASTDEQRVANEVAAKLQGLPFAIGQRVRVRLDAQLAAHVRGKEAIVAGYINPREILLDPDPLPNVPGGWHPSYLEAI